jgi:hypothetical protein
MLFLQEYFIDGNYSMPGNQLFDGVDTFKIACLSPLIRNLGMVTNYSCCPQFGQNFSSFLTTQPHLVHVVGCESPKGAPQAIQFELPNSFAVWQYSHVRRDNLSDSFVLAPASVTALLIVCQTFSVICRFSIS